MAQLSDKIVNRHTGIESKWSGKVNRLIDDGINFSGKEWNCDITLLNTASIHQSVRELLHARSISHYDRRTYRDNRALEELSVEFFTKEILKSEMIMPNPSNAYGLGIKRLSIINQKREYVTLIMILQRLYLKRLSSKERDGCGIKSLTEVIVLWNIIKILSIWRRC